MTLRLSGFSEPKRSAPSSNWGAIVRGIQHSGGPLETAKIFLSDAHNLEWMSPQFHLFPEDAGIASKFAFQAG